MTGPETTISHGDKETSFTFDHSYFHGTKSSEVYSDLGQPLLEKALEGYNATIFAYGQTGSGKTYCMTGTEEERGIIPLMNKALFDHIESASPTKKFLVTVSYLEIYQEVIHDLLNPHGKDMKVRQHPQFGVYVEGLAELVVRSGKDIEQLQLQGNRVRKVAATEMNQRSSRSHSVFMLSIKQRGEGDGDGELKAKVNLVDLAGSERAESTGAQGHTLKEGAAINKSLSALGNVINALADLRKKGQHIPYRDSKLTRILEESLGGNCLTVMLAMVSPADYNYAETFSTLQFANRAKNITNVSRKNEDENTRLIRTLREEISQLRDDLVQEVGPGGVVSTVSSKEVTRLEEMISDLQVAKQQTWEEKERLSRMYEDERKNNLANKGILELVMDTLKKEQQEAQERLRVLYEERDGLTASYKDKKKHVDELKEQLQQKINDYSKLSESGELNDSVQQTQLADIHSLKDQLKAENDSLKSVKQTLKDLQEKIKSEKEDTRVQSSLLRSNIELREMIQADERRKIEGENAAILRDNLETLKLEIEQEKAELKLKVSQGANYKLEESVTMETELIELRAQKHMTALQVETLEQEKRQLSIDLEEAYRRHKEDMEMQQMHHFQVFRAYRECFDEQKIVIEQRFRQLLEEAIQDAVYLSMENSQLKASSQNIRQEMSLYKDTVTRAGLTTPKTQYN
ncbi:kinesin-like protein klp-20 [Halichondria panicea]|uniref:kinesin-like protein klp-20 n=1 Tax=Halichondria panicea TaxID=6063 RepID=UPI00312B893D